MDLLFRKNQTFLLTLNVAAWEPVYPLALCKFRMMARASLTSPNVACAWSSDPADGFSGTIAYSAGAHSLTMRTPYESARLFNDGSFEFDLQLIYSQVVKLLTSGTLVIESGATR